VRRRLIDWREFCLGRRQRGNRLCSVESLKEVFSGVEGEDGGENGERQQDKQHAKKQPGNEEFPCAVGVAAKAEAEEQQGKWNREKAVAEKPEETVEKYWH
jgi:hypothetical protein